MITEETKKQIQRDYEAITNFTGNWIQVLIDKYNLSATELLNIIEF